MSATGSKDADPSVDIGVCVGGLVKIVSRIDRVHIDIEVFVTGSEIDVNHLKVVFVVGVGLEGLFQRVEEGLEGIVGSERSGCYDVAEKIYVERVVVLAIVESDKWLIASGIGQGVPCNLALSVDEAETLGVGRSGDKRVLCLKEERYRVGVGDETVIVRMTYLQLVHTCSIQRRDSVENGLRRTVEVSIGMGAKSVGKEDGRNLSAFTVGKKRYT